MASERIGDKVRKKLGLLELRSTIGGTSDRLEIWGNPLTRGIEPRACYIGPDGQVRIGGRGEIEYYYENGEMVQRRVLGKKWAGYRKISYQEAVDLGTRTKQF